VTSGYKFKVAERERIARNPVSRGHSRIGNQMVHRSTLVNDLKTASMLSRPGFLKHHDHAADFGSKQSPTVAAGGLVGAHRVRTWGMRSPISKTLRPLRMHTLPRLGYHLNTMTMRPTS
jgi:hypothetical protein